MAVIVAVFFLCGCGKKGDPMPKQLVLPPAVSDLGVSLSPAGNRLTWTLPDVDIYKIVRIRIMRSELRIAGESCPGCRREFVVVAEPRPRDLSREKGSWHVEYVDTKVKPGILYTYAIILCDTYGYCGRESNRGEIKYKELGFVNP